MAVGVGIEQDGARVQTQVIRPVQGKDGVLDPPAAIVEGIGGNQRLSQIGLLVHLRRDQAAVAGPAPEAQFVGARIGEADAIQIGVDQEVPAALQP